MGRVYLFFILSLVLFFTHAAVSQNHFSFTQSTGNNASISVPAAINPSIDGQTLATGDEIGVFTPDGLCVGAIVWTGENNIITVWGNNPYNDVVDGIQPGEEIHYRVWRQSTDTEYHYVEKEYSMGNGLYVADGLYVLSYLNAVSAPAKPSLSSPLNNATDVTVNPTLQWSASSRAESYTVQVSKNLNMSSPVVNQSGVTGTSYNVNGLDYETKYYWRVRAGNAAGESPWSDTRNFTTEVLVISIDIQLQAGWNMISSRVIPVESDIETIFSEMVSDLVLVKNGDGETYWPGQVVNQIGEWDYKSGYQVYMNTGRELNMVGRPVIPSEETIALPSGWSMVAYFSESPFDPAVALESLGNDLMIAKSSTGGVYWPEFEANTMGDMIPGQGYQVFLHNPAALVYPGSDTAPANYQVFNMFADHPEHYIPSFDRTGFNATVLVLSSSLADGDEVGVYTPERELVGSGVFSSGKALLTVWGEDEFKTVGAAPGEMLSLRYHSPGDDSEGIINIESVTDAISGETVQGELAYKHNGIFVVTGSVPTPVEKEETVPAAYMLAQNYPNPFNPMTVIRFDLPEAGHTTLKVYDMTGRKVISLIDEHLTSGEYTVQWSPADVSTGTYFYRLLSGDFAQTKKLMIIK